MRNLIRKLIPQNLLTRYRQFKKERRNKILEAQRKSGEVLTTSNLLAQFKSIGINEGDALLVHSSLSKIGFVEEGPKTVVKALLEAVGETGHLLMPNSPNAQLQLDYIRQLEVFDVKNSQSKLGAISEYFRKLPNAIRSAHPTEPVSCLGPNAFYFVESHFGNLTPYNKNSPFYKVAEAKGKILYLGVTLDNAGTSLHVLEDLVSDFVDPVYFDEEFKVTVRFEDGTEKEMVTKVHNPVQSAKRKCDGLIPLFESEGVLKHVKIGQAEGLLVDAKGMLDVMIKHYKERGVTMYKPLGN